VSWKRNAASDIPGASVYNRATFVQKLFAFVAAWLLVPALVQPAATGLSESGRLAAVYETILQARFNQARGEISRSCPPAPPESCLALAAVDVWWEIQLDPNNRRLDKSLQTASAAAIDAAERWTRREPQRAEAWFYLAGAHAPLEQWRVLRGQRLAAARDARRLKDALDQTLALDPMLQDGYFGIGLYHYYAAVAPATVKVLRWLLLMPGGNREEGLREMQRAREQGALLRAEADYQLHWLYLWYEHQPDRALDLLRGLDARYPSNPLFVQRIAEVERDYRHDHAASTAAWQTLLDRATRGEVELAAMSAVRARIGLAAEFVATAQARRAIDLLAPLAEAHPAAPYGAEALVHFVLGRAYDTVSDRERAVIEWRRAIAIAPADDPDNIRSRARTAIEHASR
jgi:tetratricopeptide (TPR) repeat protein